MFIATEHLYQTADKSELVSEGDERAAFLFCTPGTEVPDQDAERYGLAKAARPARDKAAAAPANKAAAARATKAAKKSSGLTINRLSKQA